MTLRSAGASPMISRHAAPGAELLAEDEVLGNQPPLRQRALDQQRQVVGIDRLGKKVERPCLIAATAS